MLNNFVYQYFYRNKIYLLFFYIISINSRTSRYCTARRKNVTTIQTSSSFIQTKFLKRLQARFQDMKTIVIHTKPLYTLLDMCILLSDCHLLSAAKQNENKTKFQFLKTCLRIFKNRIFS